MTLKCTVCTVRGIRYQVDMIPHWPIKCPICHNNLEEEPEVGREDIYWPENGSYRTLDYEHGDE